MSAGDSSRKIASGMRPTGRLHLGHYHGVIKNWVRLQHTYECYFFAADWHALTTGYQDTKEIERNTFDMVVDWLAAGVDPGAATIFIQSKVPEHAELHLLLSMISPVSWLERAPTYKDMQAKLSDRDLATYGFLGYPVLQAADILMYRAGNVPVGADQVAHLELVREIARRFNHVFGRIVLPEPQALLTEHARMPGLDGQKMSKSYNNTIRLREPAEDIERKVRTMKTDPARVRRKDPGDPANCPVFDLHQVYSEPETLDWAARGCRSAGIGCLDCKRPLIEAINAEQNVMIDRAERFRDQPDLVHAILQEGAEKARDVARDTLEDVRASVGIVHG